MSLRSHCKQSTLVPHAVNASAVSYFTATQIASIYKFPAPNPTIPVVVAVISFGGGLFGTVNPSTGALTGGDVQAYWTSLGIASANQPKVVVVTVDGATNTPLANDGSTIENTIDVAMIGGCCPSSNLTIVLYIAPNTFDAFTTNELIAIFSCFTNITVSEELRSALPTSQNREVQKIIYEMINQKRIIEDKEASLNINTGTIYDMQFDLINYAFEWCNCENVVDCKLLLQKISTEKEIFLGEFVKALLKINNIACELEKVAECIGNIPLLHKLKEIPQKTLKYVATNQSLYI